MRNICGAQLYQHTCFRAVASLPSRPRDCFTCPKFLLWERTLAALETRHGMHHHRHRWMAATHDTLDLRCRVVFGGLAALAMVDHSSICAFLQTLALRTAVWSHTCLWEFNGRKGREWNGKK